MYLNCIILNNSFERCAEIYDERLDNFELVALNLLVVGVAFVPNLVRCSHLNLRRSNLNLLCKAFCTKSNGYSKIIYL